MILLAGFGFGAAQPSPAPTAGSGDASCAASPFVFAGSSPQPWVAVVEVSVGAPHSDEACAATDEAAATSPQPVGAGVDDAAAAAGVTQVGAAAVGAGAVNEAGVVPFEAPFAYGARGVAAETIPPRAPRGTPRPPRPATVIRSKSG